MNTWPDSIPAYLHNTAMGESFLRRYKEVATGIIESASKLSLLAEPLATGAAIKARRIELGMSQTEVAQALDCTASNISQIEGRETVDRKTDLAFRAIFAAKQANQE